MFGTAAPTHADSLHLPSSDNLMARSASSIAEHMSKRCRMGVGRRSIGDCDSASLDGLKLHSLWGSRSEARCALPRRRVALIPCSPKLKTAAALDQRPSQRSRPSPRPSVGCDAGRTGLAQRPLGDPSRKSWANTLAGCSGLLRVAQLPRAATDQQSSPG